MNDYAEELNRRIGQFLSILKKMHRRVHGEIQDHCFVIFDEHNPKSGSRRELSAAVELSEELILAGFAEAGVDSTTCNDHRADIQLPSQGWRSSGAMSRFVQFSFEEKWFCMDLPLQTLYRDEGETILRSRNGFFYLTDRPEFTLKGEDVDDFDPFRKIYVYEDEWSAAEDMAYIWFQLWKFPIDWAFYVTAHPFNGRRVEWESGKRLS